MVLHDQAAFASTIKKQTDNSLIHNLFIFNKSGVCFYGKNFTDYIKVEKNLLSPFITALMSFSKEMIGKKFKIIEMEDVKIVIFEKNSLYYGVLCNTVENLAILEDLISRVSQSLITYLIKNNIKLDAEIIHDSDLNDTIEGIINTALSCELESKQGKKVIQLLKNRYLTGEFEGIIFLTNRGKVVYSSFHKLDLRKFLNEVEFRVKICNNSILKLFYTFKDSKFIFSEYILNSYFIILVFGSDVKFGLAEHYLTKLVHKIKKILIE